MGSFTSHSILPVSYTHLCHEVDLDYGDEKGEIVKEEEEKEGLEERQVEELDDEHNPNRSESSEVSCPESDSEETSQYSSTRNSFSESGVRKERVPKFLSLIHI